MINLDPSQPLPAGEPGEARPQTKRQVSVMVSANFNLPGNKGFISKPGNGTNLKRAICDAVANICNDARLRGKRTDTLLAVPVKFVVSK